MIIAGLFQIQMEEDEMAIDCSARYSLRQSYIMANFKMAADHMFYQPKKLLVNAAENKVDSHQAGNRCRQ